MLSVRQEKAQRKQQLATQIREACRAGALAPGSLLPSVRDLAVEHHLSKRVVNDELQKLVDEGLLRSVPRVGIFVQDSVTVGSRQAGNGQFLRDTVVILSPDTGQVPRHQQRSGWISYIAVGAMRAIEERGLNAMFLHPGRLCGEVVDRLVREAVMGVLVPENFSDWNRVLGYGRQLQQGGVPIVLNTGDEHMAQFDRVASDAEQGGYELTRWLLQQGRRRVHQVWPAGLDAYWSHERAAGYRRAMREAGLEPQEPIFVPQLEARLSASAEDISAIAAGLAPHFEGAARPDALMAASDGPASTLDAACRLLGIDPEQDILVTGYDNYWQDLLEAGWAPHPPQATIDRRNEEIGAAMVHLLLERVHPAQHDGAQHNGAQHIGALPDELAGPRTVRIAPRLVLPTSAGTVPSALSRGVRGPSATRTEPTRAIFGGVS